MDAQIQHLSHLPPTLRQELQSAKEAKQAAQLKAIRIQTAMLKTLLLIRGLGTTLDEPSCFLMKAYEDAEQKQHVILARWNANVAGKERCKPLFEFTFGAGELIIRWFDKTVVANLPTTEEDKVTDTNRCEALHSCVASLHKQDKLPLRIRLTILEFEAENAHRWPRYVGRYSVGIGFSKRSGYTHDVDSQMNILRQDSYWLFGLR